MSAFLLAIGDYVKRKRAFTLIELLVVIAIIAILAAILFPVFAQAKLAAKKIVSVSNVKQITLAEIMYQNDYDDDFVLSTQNYTDSQCGIAAQSGTFWCLDNLASPMYCWPNLMEPYIKTLGLFVEPGTGDPNGFFNNSSASVAGNWNLYAQYGYNYTFLSPLDLTVAPVGYSFPICGVGRSSTAAVNPAGLVMFVGDQGFAVTASGDMASSNSAAYNPSSDYDFLIPPGVLYNLINSPGDRQVFLGSYSAPQWVSSWVKNTPIGPLTANVRTMSPYQGGVTGFADGHAKVLTPDQLAAGTDYGTSNTSEGTVFGSGTGSQVTNINDYLWTLDGTLNDVN